MGNSDSSEQKEVKYRFTPDCNSLEVIKFDNGTILYIYKFDDNEYNLTFENCDKLINQITPPIKSFFIPNGAVPAVLSLTARSAFHENN